MKTLKLLYVITMIGVSIYLYLNYDKNLEVEEPIKHLKQEQINVDDFLVEVKRSDETIMIELETYLIGVVGSEMPASYNIEALKAQAIAARTFAANRQFKVDDTTASQVYHSDEQLKAIWKDEYEVRAKTIMKAVNDTKSLVLKYKGDYISALFYSSCNGKTNNSEDYWSGDVPYLISVNSPWDLEDVNTIQTKVISKIEVANTLGFTNLITNIDIDKYPNGYVKTAIIDTISFSGREVREKLKLRSSDFEFKEDGDNYVITTKGYGHGVGMSQVGAQGMALDGYSYDQILKHYYTNVSIEKIVYK